MTQEDKELLLKDLCARLPYRVKVTNGIYTIALTPCSDTSIIIKNENILPYLRQMSSMTEEEKEELSKRYVWEINGSEIKIKYHSDGYWDNDIDCPTEEYLWLFDWLNEHHFDYRGLIPKGLAIEVTKENNPYKK